MSAQASSVASAGYVYIVQHRKGSPREFWNGRAWTWRPILATPYYPETAKRIIAKRFSGRDRAPSIVPVTAFIRKQKKYE